MTPITHFNQAFQTADSRRVWHLEGVEECSARYDRATDLDIWELIPYHNRCLMCYRFGRKNEPLNR